jgi:hypothetical protein
VKLALEILDMRHFLPALVVINVIGCDKKADPPAPTTLASASPISSQEAAARAAKVDADKKAAEAQAAAEQQLATARTKVRFEAGGSLTYMSASDIAAFCAGKKLPPVWSLCVSKDSSKAADTAACAALGTTAGCVLADPEKNPVNFCCTRLP